MPALIFTIVCDSMTALFHRLRKTVTQTWSMSTDSMLRLLTQSTLPFS